MIVKGYHSQYRRRINRSNRLWSPNVAAGQKVPVATIGTTLYTAEGEVWTIKKGKIRGEASHGMICAEDELGLGMTTTVSWS